MVADRKQVCGGQKPLVDRTGTAQGGRQTQTTLTAQRERDMREMKMERRRRRMKQTEDKQIL